MAGASVRITADLRRRLVDQILRLGPGWVAEERSGELEAVLVDGVERLDACFGCSSRRSSWRGSPQSRSSSSSGSSTPSSAPSSPSSPACSSRSRRSSTGRSARTCASGRRAIVPRGGVRRRPPGDGHAEDVRCGAPARPTCSAGPRGARRGHPVDERVGRLLGPDGVRGGSRRRRSARRGRVPSRRRRHHGLRAAVDPPARRRMLPAGPRDQRGDAPRRMGNVEVQRAFSVLDTRSRVESPDGRATAETSRRRSGSRA